MIKCSGIKIDKKYEDLGLEPMLEQWVWCIEEYARLFDGDDLAYWYNERANVGILAGAAWRAGIIAVEESQVKKEGNERLGRSDLYLYSEKTDNQMYIEAKYIFPSADNYINEVDSQLDQATKEAERICDENIEDERCKLGLVFVTPSFLSKPASERDILKLIGGIEKHSAPIKAWCFPGNAQKIKSKHEKYYPGAFIFMKGLSEIALI